MKPVSENLPEVYSCSSTRLVNQIKKEPYSGIKNFVFFCFFYFAWHDQRLHFWETQQPLSEEFTFEKKAWRGKVLCWPFCRRRIFTKLHLLRFSFWIRLLWVKEMFLLQDEFADFNVFLDCHFLQFLKLFPFSWY